ncbi:unnamed protein product [Amoebophrya sp. A120]|nr:unnamed protein product [Amoebophrya sp. A120]|eukprot:GSA120T00009655001.1
MLLLLNGERVTTIAQQSSTTFPDPNEAVLSLVRKQVVEKQKKAQFIFFRKKYQSTLIQLQVTEEDAKNFTTWGITVSEKAKVTEIEEGIEEETSFAKSNSLQVNDQLIIIDSDFVFAKPDKMQAYLDKNNGEPGSVMKAGTQILVKRLPPGFPEALRIREANVERALSSKWQKWVNEKAASSGGQVQLPGAAAATTVAADAQEKEPAPAQSMTKSMLVGGVSMKGGEESMTKSTKEKSPFASMAEPAPSMTKSMLMEKEKSPFASMAKAKEIMKKEEEKPKPGVPAAGAENTAERTAVAPAAAASSPGAPAASSSGHLSRRVKDTSSPPTTQFLYGILAASLSGSQYADFGISGWQQSSIDETVLDDTNLTADEKMMKLFGVHLDWIDFPIVTVSKMQEKNENGEPTRAASGKIAEGDLLLLINGERVTTVAQLEKPADGSPPPAHPNDAVLAMIKKQIVTKQKKAQLLFFRKKYQDTWFQFQVTDEDKKNHAHWGFLAANGKVSEILNAPTENKKHNDPEHPYHSWAAKNKLEVNDKILFVDADFILKKPEKLDQLLLDHHQNPEYDLPMKHKAGTQVLAFRKPPGFPAALRVRESDVERKFGRRWEKAVGRVESDTVQHQHKEAVSPASASAVVKPEPESMKSSTAKTSAGESAAAEPEVKAAAKTSEAVERKDGDQGKAPSTTATMKAELEEEPDDAFSLLAKDKEKLSTTYTGLKLKEKQTPTPIFHYGLLAASLSSKQYGEYGFTGWDQKTIDEKVLSDDSLSTEDKMFRLFGLTLDWSGFPIVRVKKLDSANKTARAVNAGVDLGAMLLLVNGERITTIAQQVKEYPKSPDQAILGLCQKRFEAGKRMAFLFLRKRYQGTLVQLPAVVDEKAEVMKIKFGCSIDEKTMEIKDLEGKPKTFASVYKLEKTDTILFIDQDFLLASPAKLEKYLTGGLKKGSQVLVCRKKKPPKVEGGNYLGFSPHLKKYFEANVKRPIGSELWEKFALESGVISESRPEGDAAASRAVAAKTDLPEKKKEPMDERSIKKEEDTPPRASAAKKTSEDASQKKQDGAASTTENQQAATCAAIVTARRQGRQTGVALSKTPDTSEQDRHLFLQQQMALRKAAKAKRLSSRLIDSESAEAFERRRKRQRRLQRMFLEQHEVQNSESLGTKFLAGLSSLFGVGETEHQQQPTFKTLEQAKALAKSKDKAERHKHHTHLQFGQNQESRDPLVLDDKGFILEPPAGNPEPVRVLPHLLSEEMAYLKIVLEWIELIKQTTIKPSSTFSFNVGGSSSATASSLSDYTIPRPTAATMLANFGSSLLNTITGREDLSQHEGVSAKFLELEKMSDVALEKRLQRNVEENADLVGDTGRGQNAEDNRFDGVTTSSSTFSTNFALLQKKFFPEYVEYTKRIAMQKYLRLAKIRTQYLSTLSYTCRNTISHEFALDVEVHFPETAELVEIQTRKRVLSALKLMEIESHNSHLATESAHQAAVAHEEVAVDNEDENGGEAGGKAKPTITAFAIGLQLTRINEKGELIDPVQRRRRFVKKRWKKAFKKVVLLLKVTTQFRSLIPVYGKRSTAFRVKQLSQFLMKSRGFIEDFSMGAGTSTTMQNNYQRHQLRDERQMAKARLFAIRDFLEPSVAVDAERPQEAALLFPGDSNKPQTVRETAAETRRKIAFKQGRGLIELRQLVPLVPWDDSMVAGKTKQEPKKLSGRPVKKRDSNAAKEQLSAFTYATLWEESTSVTTSAGSTSRAGATSQQQFKNHIALLQPGQLAYKELAYILHDPSLNSLILPVKAQVAKTELQTALLGPAGAAQNGEDSPDLIDNLSNNNYTNHPYRRRFQQNMQKNQNLQALQQAAKLEVLNIKEENKFLEKVLHRDRTELLLGCTNADFGGGAASGLSAPVPRMILHGNNPNNAEIWGSNNPWVLQPVSAGRKLSRSPSPIDFQTRNRRGSRSPSNHFGSRSRSPPGLVRSPRINHDRLIGSRSRSPNLMLSSRRGQVLEHVPDDVLIPQLSRGNSPSPVIGRSRSVSRGGRSASAGKRVRFNPSDAAVEPDKLRITVKQPTGERFNERAFLRHLRKSARGEAGPDGEVLFHNVRRI